MGNEIVNRKKVYQSAGWKFFERVFVEGMSFAIQIVLARILMPEDFGNLAIIVAIINYASLFVQSGLATAIVQKKDADDLDVSTLLVSSLAIAFFFYVVIFFFAPFISSFYDNDALVWPIRVLSIVLFLNAINSIQTAVFSKKMDFKSIFIRSVIAIPISGFIGVFMAIKGFGIWSLIAQSLVNSFLIVIFMMFRSKIKFSFKFSFKRAKELYAFGGKILLTSLVSGMSDLTRTLIIGKKYSTDELAYYDKAYTYSNYFTLMINSTIASVLLPTFSYFQDSIERLKKMARESFRYISFFMFPILFGICAVSKEFVLIFLSDKWSFCIPYLMVFCFLRISGCLTSADKQVYYALGKSGISLIYNIVLIAANIVALAIAMNFGVIYIAIGATLVELIGCFVYFLISSKIYRYSLNERFSDCIEPLISSIFMLVALFGVDALKILLGIVIYFSICFVLKNKTLYEIITKLKKR